MHSLPKSVYVAHSEELSGWMQNVLFPHLRSIGFTPILSENTSSENPEKCADFMLFVIESALKGTAFLAFMKAILYAAKGQKPTILLFFPARGLQEDEVRELSTYFEKTFPSTHFFFSIDSLKSWFEEYTKLTQGV
jgi:hypothetical protein